MEFFSHPKYETNFDPHLEAHLIKVAENVEKLLKDVNISKEKKTATMYAGLLHDIGKLSNAYQKMFNVSTPEELSKNKDPNRKHAIYSAWIAYNLLDQLKYEKDGISKLTYNQVIAIIASHHTYLKAPSGNKYKFSEDLFNNLKEFIEQVKSKYPFNKLRYENIEDWKDDKISFQGIEFGSGENYSDFLDMNIMFSALLQADRGSFNNKTEKPPFINNKGEMSIKLNTDKLRREGAKLSDLRNRFQEYVLKNFNPDNNIIIVEAPTGIGKTKLFLDMIRKYRNKKRLIYFAPFLALSDDFVDKIEDITEKYDQNYNILVYNSIFSGKLGDKYDNEEDETNTLDKKDVKDFDVESFNFPFVITTTQRLLMTIFSNKDSDKLKLLSLADSILVIDEIQIVPSHILGILMDILYELSQKLNFKVIILSATIPYIIKEKIKDKANVAIINSTNDENLQQIIDNYRKETKKMIEYEKYEPDLAYKKIISNIKEEGKTLVMFNTREKARDFAKKLKDINKEFFYITSGVRKKDREERIKSIRKATNCIVISTQTLEAGVDLDFDKVFRECAPLSSIIQAMGRLNREAKHKESVLTVFNILDGKYPKPYYKFEVDLSSEFLEKIKDSEDLYNEFPKYSEQIYIGNKLEEGYEKDLSELIKKVDNEGVWDKVRNSLYDEYGDTIFVPKDENELKEMKELFSKNFSLAYRKYAETQAKLPGTVKYLDFREYLDQDLIEKDILLLKDLDKYDPVFGLDEQIKSNNVQNRII